MNAFQMRERLKTVDFANYQTLSRVHPLRSFVFPGVKCFVKREDELGFGISGYKIRKYLSLIPYILKQSPYEVVILGAPYSNNVLGLSQLLCENGITPIGFFAAAEQDPTGNFLFSSLFIKKENRHWFGKTSWNDLAFLANAYKLEKARFGKKVLVIPNGGNSPEALTGLLTLSLDILRNEEILQENFDHIFIDSGTGLTAAVLLLALSFLQKKTHLHIIHIGGKREEFEEIRCWTQPLLETFMDEKCPPLIPYTVHSPTNAKSFGSVNSKIISSIKEIAANEGFLIDPLYNAKLFYETRLILSDSSQGIQGNVLLIHSGGALTLSGFTSKFY